MKPAKDRKRTKQQQREAAEKAALRQRLVDMAAQKMAAEFFSNFEAQLVALHPMPPASAIDEEPVELHIWKRLWNWLKRIAGASPVKATDA